MNRQRKNSTMAKRLLEIITILILIFIAITVIRLGLYFTIGVNNIIPSTVRIESLKKIFYPSLVPLKSSQVTKNEIVEKTRIELKLKKLYKRREELENELLKEEDKSRLKDIKNEIKKIDKEISHLKKQLEEIALKDYILPGKYKDLTTFYLDNVQTLLSYIQVIIVIFTVIIGAITLGATIGGFKVYRSYIEFKGKVDVVDDYTIENLISTAQSIPSLFFSTIVPSAYMHVLKLINDKLKDRKLREVSARDERLMRIFYLQSLYLWLNGNYQESVDVLEWMIGKKPNVYDVKPCRITDNSLLDEVKFRLALGYNQLKDDPEEELPGDPKRVAPEEYKLLFEMIEKFRKKEYDECIRSYIKNRIEEYKENERDDKMKEIIESEKGVYFYLGYHYMLYWSYKKNSSNKEDKNKEAIIKLLEESLTTILTQLCLSQLDSPNMLTTWYYSLYQITNEEEYKKLSEQYLNLSRKKGIRYFYVGSHMREFFCKNFEDFEKKWKVNHEN